MDILYSLFSPIVYFPLLFIVSFLIGIVASVITIFLFNLWLPKDKKFTLTIFSVFSLVYLITSMSMLGDSFVKVDSGKTLYYKDKTETLTSSKYILNKGLIIVDEDFKQPPSHTMDFSTTYQEFTFKVSLTELKPVNLRQIQSRLDKKESNLLTNEDMETYISDRMRPIIQEKLNQLNTSLYDESFIMEELERHIKENTGLIVTISKP